MLSLPRFPRPPFPSSFARHLLRQLDQRTPLWIKQKLLEPQLNQLFGSYIEEGEFDLLAGRFITLKLRDFEIQITITLEDDQLKLSHESGEVTISGELDIFIQLAKQQVDADGLFFQRKLLIEGDTELGLGVRNLLDSLEWSLEDSKVGWLLTQLESLRQQFTSAMPTYQTAEPNR